MKHVIEESYPISFRKAEAEELGAHLKNRHSVVLVGMKRVGISNFLRFFMYRDAISQTYIRDGLETIFVHVDLNDLIERNIAAFWTLLLTRLVDAVQRSKLPESEKRSCRRLFVQSIQLKDQFFTVDSVRKVLESLNGAGLYPTLFLLRFDRLSDVVTPEFFSNLLGLRDAVKQRMSYVFTSYRPLSDLAPDVFKKQSLSIVTKEMYLKPVRTDDINAIVDTLKAEYHTSFDEKTTDALIALSGGYVQYLQLAIIRLHEEKTIPSAKAELLELLSKDEQIVFQSEELFESLTKVEKEMLLQIKQGNPLSPEQKDSAKYLWNTGIVKDEGGKTIFFSPLFTEYLGTLSMVLTTGKDFTKKENLLYIFLKAHEDELCEREAIIEAVWPESRDLGVSDWAIDRLVARLRGKLKVHHSPYQVMTVVTRGYKLVKV